MINIAFKNNEIFKACSTSTGKTKEQVLDKLAVMPPLNVFRAVDFMISIPCAELNSQILFIDDIKK